MNYRTSPQEAEFFKEEGYLIIPLQIFSDEEFARLSAYSRDLFAKHTPEGGRTPALVDCPHWTDPTLFEWIASPAMLDLVEPLIGPDIAIFASHFLQKPPAVGKRVPWHEDSAYWKKILDPLIVASITIAFTPANSANGCLRVIPGTHANGYSDYGDVANPDEQVFPIEILPEQVDESRAVDIVLEPNQASVHDGRIMHSSAPNTGAMGRSCLTVRYFPTHVKFDRSQWGHTNFHVFLVRGEDKAGNDYSPITLGLGGLDPGACTA